MGIEYELKFTATPDILPVIAGQYGTESVRYQMETTYYDTPSCALSQRHYTLRRRLENGKSVCTLKTPAGQDTRKELETECSSIYDALPALIRMGAPEDFCALLDEGIAPLCGAKFTRLAFTIPYGSSLLELALDEGSLSGGGKTIPLCEVEVELKKGSQEDANMFALLLAEAYHLEPEPRSKFFRARMLSKGEDL